LLHMPGNLAVLDMNAADGILQEYPEIEEWYIGGHSLGGSMAASYIDKHADEFEGLVLLAAYSTADLTDDDLKVISIYGSEDKVLNLEKYEEYRENLPENLGEVIIQGGNHAQFGIYGAQEGDGAAVISNAEQIERTAGVIVEQVFGDE
ncbi:MAG: alpha/beta hydrolase, partial [Lachnospiraceae bacterium]|nr:alpha/beta hydrolase [Lachnospiraceae bacterium]